MTHIAMPDYITNIANININYSSFNTNDNGYTENKAYIYDIYDKDYIKDIENRESIDNNIDTVWIGGTMNQINVKDMRLNEAVEILEKLGFKNVLRPAIVSAEKVSNGQFKKCLVEAYQNPVSRDENLRYIGSCLCLCTKRATDLLREVGIAVNYDQLVAIGLKQGLELRSVMVEYQKTGSVEKLNEIKMAFQATTPVQQAQVQGAHQENQDQQYSGNEQEGKTEYRSIHFYGKDTALCFSASKTRGGANTINIDAAKLNGGGGRNFDWKNAVHFQFTPRELYSVVSVFMKIRNSVEFKSHGANNDKGFSIERQDGKFYLKLFSKEGGSRAVPVMVDDAVNLAILVIDQIAAENPDYRKPDLLSVIKMVMG